MSATEQTRSDDTVMDYAQQEAVVTDAAQQDLVIEDDGPTAGAAPAAAGSATPEELAPAEEPAVETPTVVEPISQVEPVPAADEPAVETPADPTDEPGAVGPEGVEAPKDVEPDTVEEPAVVEPDTLEEPAVVEPDTVEAAVVEPDAVGAPAVVEPEAVEAPDAADKPGEPAAPDATPAAAPTPTPPKPRPMPRPPLGGPKPTTPATVAPHAPTVPTPPDLSDTELAEAASWGRVAEDGTVWVREAAGEREVGQYPDTEPTEALAFYVRRYADLHAKVLLFEARISATDLSVKEMDATIANLATELEAPAAVGNLDGLRARLEALRGLAGERRAAAEAERAAAKLVALEARTAMVEAAEKIAATEPERMQWRPAGEQLRVLLEEWKDAQRRGPRLDRTSEDTLWKRFSHARSTFDRERRRWFAELEKSNTTARSQKEQLVASAEALATSTDWAGTSAVFRDLMADWKNAGHASRKDDDALWARFRAAQDAFFEARDTFHKQTDAEFSANLEVKLGLLEQAERLVPVTDIAAAKAAIRGIQERWEKVGKVPRADVQRIEARLRAVEQAVRDAEQAKWQRTNPETRARAEGAAAQLVAGIASLEADLERATAAGDKRKIKEIQEALSARRVWLEQVERAAAESRG